MTCTATCSRKGRTSTRRSRIPEAQTAGWSGGPLPAGITSASVHDLAAAEGWTLAADLPRTVIGPRCWVWRAADGEVSLVEDHRAGTRHVLARPASLAERLTATLRLVSLTDLLERARTASEPQERMWAVRALAVRQHDAAIAVAQAAPDEPDHPGYALPPDDPRYLEAFERALDDPVRGVRRAGLEGLAHSPWPGSRAILRARRESLPEFAELIEERLDAEPILIAKDS